MVRSEVVAPHVPLAARAAPRPEVIAQIGPNSVLQTLAALDLLEGPAVRAEVEAEARLPDAWPEGLIPEAWFLEVIEATRRVLPSHRAEVVLDLAGERTADYVAANRIPGIFRALLGVLPARIAVPMLLSAFARHAWTFAGSGAFTVEGGYPGVIRLEGCPTCRVPTAAPQGGAYYEAAFEGLLRLATPYVQVTEIACRLRGHSACRFQISLGAASSPGDSPCASC